MAFISPMKATQPTLPVVVPVGFVGPRDLSPEGDALYPVQLEALHSVVQSKLMESLQNLPRDLGLGSHHFLCGISQLAVGADTLFTQACASLRLPQRIFLPQPRHEFLSARNSEGHPDFSPDDQEAAGRLLDSDHIIQEQVVSLASDRHARFEEVNLEIIRVAEVLICITGAQSKGKPGGTFQFLDAALRHLKPVLEIHVAWKNDQPEITASWHRPDRTASSSRPFHPPALPAEVASIPVARSTAPNGSMIPITIDDYLSSLKTVGSSQAKWLRKVFKFAALFIIGAHLLATLAAVLALKLNAPKVLPWLLGGELVLLLVGGLVHVKLHHSHAVRIWATHRLIAEIARSVKALRGIHVQLGYLFSLPFPPTLRPLLRTINVLHLASTRSPASPPQSANATPDAASSREPNPAAAISSGYLAQRLEQQIIYYRDNLSAAKRHYAIASRTFYTCTSLAFVATSLKLLAICHVLHFPGGHDHPMVSAFGALAILLPVLAVGALSLAASFDLEARIHTFEDTHDFLLQVQPRIAAARSTVELSRLILETEARLLGETANWASRRSFANVS